MTRPPMSLLAIRDAQIRWCSCGNRLLGEQSCIVCAMLRVETARAAS